MMKQLGTLLLLLLVTMLVVTMASFVKAQTREWRITIYLPIDPNDKTPNETKNILFIGPPFTDRQLCRGLLPALREHFKGARRIDCD